MYGKDKEPSSILGQITTIKSVYPSNRVHGSLYFFHDTNIQKITENRCCFFLPMCRIPMNATPILNRFYHLPNNFYPFILHFSVFLKNKAYSVFIVFGYTFSLFCSPFGRKLLRIYTIVVFSYIRTFATAEHHKIIKGLYATCHRGI